MSVQGHYNYVTANGNSVTAMQVPTAYDVFLKLFESNKFDQVLEVGTAFGGTTLIVRDSLDATGQKDCRLWTCDTGHKQTPPAVNVYVEKFNNIKFFNHNIFNTKVNPWELTTDEAHSKEIIEYIQSPGKTLILCDGGCKRMEFPVLAKIMKSGDHIMAHDYAKDAETFENRIKDKVWNWQEIQYKDVAATFENQNLSFYMEEEFENVAWLSSRKP
tara:strand:+ start:48 stop:695 length:648 start_codon:yes stop_codon:yes gene_type:complete